MTAVTYDLDGELAVVVVDDGKANALGPSLQQELHGALDRAQADGAAVVIAGRPGVFSGGFDLNVLVAGGTEAVDMVQGGFELAARVLSFPRPVVIASTGHAIAMGLFLALSGDHVVGADGPYRYHANEVQIGLTMPRSAIAILRNRLTPSALQRAAVLAQPFGPADAVAAGIIDTLADPAHVVARAVEIAHTAASLHARAHHETKQRLRVAVLAEIRAGIEQDRRDLDPVEQLPIRPIDR